MPLIHTLNSTGDIVPHCFTPLVTLKEEETHVVHFRKFTYLAFRK